MIWIWLECHDSHYLVEIYTEKMLEVYTDIVYQPAKCKLCGIETCYFVRKGSTYHPFEIDYFMEIVNPIKRAYKLELTKHRKMVQHYLDPSKYEAQFIASTEKSTAWRYHRLPELDIL